MLTQLILIIESIENDKQREVIEYIYNNLFDRMYQTAYKIMQNHHDAEVAVSDASYRIVRNIDKFENLDELDIVRLVSIYAKNAALSCYLERKKRVSRECSMSAWEDEDSAEWKDMELPDISANIERLVINRETIKIFSDTLMSLGEEVHDIIMLKHYYGFRYEAIAEVYGITEGNARAKVFRAKKKLADLLGDEMYERLEF